MALTAQEVEKINSLYQQIDKLQSKLDDKELELSNMLVELNEKKQIIIKHDKQQSGELSKLYDLVQSISDKLDTFVGSATSTKKTTTRATKRK